MLRRDRTVQHKEDELKHKHDQHEQPQGPFEQAGDELFQTYLNLDAGQGSLESFRAFTSASSEATTTKYLLHLQQKYGNRYVQQMIRSSNIDNTSADNHHSQGLQETGKVTGQQTAITVSDSPHTTKTDSNHVKVQTSIRRFPLTAHIRREPFTRATSLAPSITARADDAETPIRIPDIEVPALETLERTDKTISAGFTYSSSISRGGATPSGFGVTHSFSSRLSGITITPNPDNFGVAATYEHPITYQVRSGTGPSNQVDIASDSDPDITDDNYTTIASDLTPNMGDLNGRPPRTQFWAEDLTLRHELVHANDDQGNGPGAMATVTTWLNGQTAASEDDVRILLNTLPERFSTALLAALSTEDGERNAYGDGAPAYAARATAIQDKGDVGEYE
jgi:hypothetical protein